MRHFAIELANKGGLFAVLDAADHDSEAEQQA